MSRVNKQVRLKEDTLKRLNFFKNNSKESYDDVINRIISNPDEIRLKIMEEEQKSQSEENLNRLWAWNKFIKDMEKYYKEQWRIINKNKPKNLFLESPPQAPPFPKFETKEEIMKKKIQYYKVPPRPKLSNSLDEFNFE